jgi:peroxiredoxin
MTIKIGDRLPDATLYEFIDVETEGCALGPNAFKVADLTKGKTIALFALPGAYTPTCSASHVPGFLANLEAFKAKGVDEVWCLSVNDAFVMDAWGRDQKGTGKIRFLADGSAEFTNKVGLVLDLTAKGLGVRSHRYSMLIKDGVITQLNLDEGGKLELSSAEVLLKQLG